MTCDDGAVAWDAARAEVPQALRNVVVFDCQATGSTPVHGHLLEVAWSCEDGAGAEVVRLPEGAEIPARITALTGISTDDLEGAASPQWVSALVREAIWPWLGAAHGPQGVSSPLPLGARPRPVVVHFAQFERRWLEQLFAVGAAGVLPFEVVCTHEIARRLYPELPRLSLRALAGYLGYDAPEMKRSQDHVAATAFLWSELVPQLVQRGLTDVSAVQRWLRQTPAPSRTGAFSYRVSRDKRLALPDTPGVYRFLGPQREILYVGKATSLKQRVNSYFQKRTGRAEHKMELVTRAHDLEVTQTGSPLEAALLESDEIKRHEPACNRALRTRGRAPVWATPDLREFSLEPTLLHPIGPLPRPLERAGLLAAGCSDAEQLVAWPSRWAPEPDVFFAGWELFRQRHPIRDATQLLALGDALWADRQPLEDEDDDEDVIPVRGWSPQTVCDGLLDIVRGAALCVRRAFWFRQLRGAHLRWRATHDGSMRSLTLPPPDPALPAIACYDRVRVLSTELRRVLHATNDVELTLSCGTHLRADQLRGALAWL